MEIKSDSANVKNKQNDTSTLIGQSGKLSKMKSMILRPSGSASNAVSGTTGSGSSGDSSSGGLSSGMTGGSSGTVGGSRPHTTGIKTTGGLSRSKPDGHGTEKTNHEESRKKPRLGRLDVPAGNLTHPDAAGKIDTSHQNEIQKKISKDEHTCQKITAYPPEDIDDAMRDDNDNGKGAVVSFSFTKTTGAKISSMSAFIGDVDEEEDKSKQEKTKIVNTHQISVPSVQSHVTEKPAQLLSTFIKVVSKDETVQLDWPEEMIQYTKTEPVLSYSCNPLCFDFSLLMDKSRTTITDDKINSSSSKEYQNQNVAPKISEKEEVSNVVKHNHSEELEESKQTTDSKSKSKKKRKKSKHKRSSEKKENFKDGEEEKVSDKKKKHKKRKKHRRHKDAETEGKDNDKKEKVNEHEKNSHQKHKKPKANAESDGESGDIEDSPSEGEEEKNKHKHKKRRKSKKSKKKKKRQHHDDKHKSQHGDKKEQDEAKKSSKQKHSKNKQPERMVKISYSTDEDGGNEVKLETKTKQKSNKIKDTVDGNKTEERDGEKKVSLKKENLNSGSESNVKAPKKRKNVDSVSSDEGKSEIKKQPSSERVKGSPAVSKESVNTAKKLKKESESGSERKSASSARKRQTSESSVNEATPVSVKKLKVTPKSDRDTGKAEESERQVVKTGDTWSKVENLYEAGIEENQKSKWDTSDSEIDDSVNTRHLSDTVSGKIKESKTENVAKKDVKSLNSVDKSNVKSSRKRSRSASRKRTPDRSHSRRRSYSRSYSRSRSRSHSYSSSSYSSRSRSRSYSRSRSRSRSHRSHSRSYSYSSYSDYSRSRSRSYSSRNYSSSRSRSASRSRSRYSSYSRSRSSSFSRSRSRSRSYKRRSRRSRSSRRSYSSRRHSSHSSDSSDNSSPEKKKSSKKTEKTSKVDPLDIPLPDFGADDEKSAENLVQKIKDKKQQHSEVVKKGIAATKSSESAAPESHKDFFDIPLPLQHERNPQISTCAPPPPPPVNGSMGPPLQPPMYNPPPHLQGHPQPRMPGPMMSHMNAPPPPPPGAIGMRMPPDRMPPPGMFGPPRNMGPYDPRMRFPDPRMRFPPPGMNMRPRMEPPPYENPRPGELQGNSEKQETSKEKDKSPPPLPPPKSPSPQPPPPTQKEEEKKNADEVSTNPFIVIPPEQAEQYKRLQEQAQKHASKQLRRQQKLEKGESISDSSSSEDEASESDKKTTADPDEVASIEELATPTLIAIPSPTISIAQPTMLVAQPQLTSGAIALGPQLISGIPGQPHQILLPHSQTGVPIQAGAPMIAFSPVSGAPSMAALAAAGAQPAHLPGTIHAPMHMTAGGIPIATASSSALMLHHNQMIAAQNAQLQAAAFAAHHPAIPQPQLIPVSANAIHQPGPIIVGNHLLVPRLLRPAL